MRTDPLIFLAFLLTSALLILVGRYGYNNGCMYAGVFVMMLTAAMC